MKLTENRIFLATAAIVVVLGFAIYFSGYAEEKATTTTLQQTTTTTSTTSTTTSTTSTSTTTSQASSTTSTSTTTSPAVTTTLSYYWEKYAGKGYRQVFLDVTFICPSCVPATNKLLQDEDGVISQSIGYRQENMWVIYDPQRVPLERVLVLMRSGAEATVLNDTAIP